MDFLQQFRTYIELKPYGEKYEVQAPTLSAHNLIIGTPYIDIGGTSKVRLVGKDELEINLRWTKRGWLSKEEFKVEGELTRQTGKGKKGTEYLYKISGNWNS